MQRSDAARDVQVPELRADAMTTPPWSAEEIAQIRAAADGVPVDDEYIDTWHDDRRWLATLDVERAATAAMQKQHAATNEALADALELVASERAAREAAERERDERIGWWQDRFKGVCDALTAAETRAHAAEREVQELRRAMIEAIPTCSTDETDYRMVRLGLEGWNIRALQVEAAASRLLLTSVSDSAWGDRAAELRALVDHGGA